MYGDVLAPPQRKKLADEYANSDVSLRFMDQPAVVQQQGTRSHVFIDLDDPRFTPPQFLVSLAKSDGIADVVGSSRNPELDVAHYAKLGVTEILSPDKCLERLHQLLNSLEQTGSPRKGSSAKDDSSSRFNMDALVGESTWMREIQSMVQALSEVDFPIALILGETGTGKSLVSRILHNSGVRREHNLVEVNCSAIPDELFGSELFGHVRGAFTDAKVDKKGLFEFAQNGTLFLDEVGDLTPAAQAKLLKVLEDKKLRRVGSVAAAEVNVRVVTATNRDLEEVVSEGRFREDLFYRLNLLSITVPPLRDHAEDIPDLADYYFSYYGTNYGKPSLAIAPETYGILKVHSWPGNVRELCNVIERAVLLNKSGVIEPGDIGLAIDKDRLDMADRQRITIDIPTQGITLREIEVEAVKQVLNMFDWNRSRTAEYLGISRPRLRRLIDSAGLDQNKRIV